MGFDNWEILATNARPPLTTIDMNFQTLGRTAAERLFAAIDGSQHRGLEALPTRVVIRDSTAPST